MEEILIIKVPLAWDSFDYLTIAANGHTSNTLYAFSPVYHYLVRGFSVIFISYCLSSLIVINTFGYIFIILAYKFYGDRGDIVILLVPSLLHVLVYLR
jgi:hypothetical protein